MNKRRLKVILPAVLVLLLVSLWGVKHTYEIYSEQITNLKFILTVAYFALVYTVVVPLFHRDLNATSRELKTIFYDEYLLTIVPAHNEDIAMFKAMLYSINKQTRKPNRLHIVENGNPKAGYKPALHSVVSEWINEVNPSFEILYDFNPIADKREAQALAIKACPEATIHQTLDSDVELGTARSIESGLEPFSDKTVTSVCGLLLGKNTNKSLLTRIIDTGFVASFLNGRASYSMLGSVAVNAGGLAFYRASVMKKYINHYLNHKIFSRKISHGDDSMWTMYALLEGRTLFQRGALGYTLHPENIKHLTKQRLRWHRSWFWGDLWLLRYFSPKKPIWIMTLIQMLLFVWFTFAVPAILIVNPIINASFSWELVLWLAIIGWISSLSYLTVDRTDIKYSSQILNWILSPLAVFLNLYIGWTLKYVAMFTPLKADWGTRQKVEVGVE